MKNIIIYSLSIFFFWFQSFYAVAQEEENKLNEYLPTIIPPSPDAASLGKYGEFPVSLYTGTPSVSVPIAQVSGHAIKVPISLSYHASGVKVEDIAPWTGLGWSLNAGGAITRVVKGKADDLNDGYFDTVESFVDFPVTESHDKYLQFLYEGSRGVIDTEPDMYLFNFMGYSGKFFIDKDKNIHLIPHKDLKIIPPTDPSTGEFRFESGEWQVITEDGTIYKFGGNGFTETTISVTYGESSAAPAHASAWFLKEISKQDRNDKVTFEYEQEIIKYDTRASYTDFDKSVSCAAKLPIATYSEMENNTYHLKSIKVNGKLAAKFNTTISDVIDQPMHDFVRLDMYKSGGQNAADVLKEIEIYSITESSSPVKRFMLEYDHFQSTSSNCNWITSSHNSASLTYRLRLKSIKEVSTADASEKKLLSSFTYHEGLPSRCSNDQDHWGYFNNANNATLLPSFNSFKDGEGGNREVNPDVITNGTLSRIDFPTGGYSKFYFKPHRREINETIVIPEPRTLSFEQLDATVEIVDLRNFTLSHDQEITIDYTISHPTHGDVDSGGGSLGKLFLEDGQGAQIDYWSSGGFNSNDITLPAGSYTLKFDGFIAGTNVDGDIFYEYLDENGTGRNEILDIDGLAAGGKVTTNPFILAKESSILFNIDALESATTATIRLYKEDIFLQEVDVISSAVNKEISVDNLTPGEYSVEVQNTGSATLNNFDLNVGYMWHNILSAYIGGLKIVKIESYDGTSNAPLVKQFQYEELNEVSPIVETSYIYTVNEIANANCPYQVGQNCGYKARSSSNRSFLGATQGSAVGYEKVTTMIGPNAELGKIIDEFTFHTNVGGGGFPFPAATELQWRSGLLKKQTVYNASGDKLKETANEYKFIPLASITGQKVAFKLDHPCYDYDGNDDFEALNWDIFTGIMNYDFKSEWVQHISATETVYDQNDPSKSITTTSTNHFKDVSEYGTGTFHSMLQKSVSEDSKGQEIITELKYPLDNTFSEPLSTDAENARLSMVSKHIISPVLETIISKKVDGVTTILSKAKTNYSFDFGLLPGNVELASKGGSYESRVRYHKYDIYGNILEFSQEGGTHKNYIWNYENTMPTAQVISPADLTASHRDIAYTSFEAGDFQYVVDWQFNATAVTSNLGAKTGNNFYNITTASDNITKSYLDQDKNYILSFWAKGNTVTVAGVDYTLTSEWQYIELPVNGVTSLTISGNLTSIDELRIYPRGAQMTTFTYAPSIGLTSICDANNVITYYEYDAFGRLEYVKDAEKNILKKHEYKYGQ